MLLESSRDDIHRGLCFIRGVKHLFERAKAKNLNLSYKALQRLQTGVQAFDDTLRAFEWEKEEKLK